MDNTAKLFREAAQVIQKTFGNKIIVFNKNKVLLPHSFIGTVGRKHFKEFTRVQCKTVDDISFLEVDFYIAQEAHPSSLFKIWSIEPKFYQNELVHTTLMLTNIEEDGAQRIVQSLPDLT